MGLNPPSKWWGYPGIALAACVIYLIADPWQEAHLGMSKEAAFITAAIVLMFAWQSFLHKVCLVFWAIEQAYDEENLLRKDIASLPLADARVKALECLKDPMRFRCAPAKSASGRDLPPVLKDLFHIYESIEARDYPEAVRLNVKDVCDSETASGFINIGRYFENEIAIRPGDDTIYELNGAQNGGRWERESLPSIFHWVVLTAERLAQSREIP